jgi:membrane fusion protein, heavy metal efflux system
VLWGYGVRQELVVVESMAKSRPFAPRGWSTAGAMIAVACLQSPMAACKGTPVDRLAQLYHTNAHVNAGHTGAASTADRWLPVKLDAPRTLSCPQSPLIVGASEDVNTARSPVRVFEAAPLSTVSVVGRLSRIGRTDAIFGPTCKYDASLLSETMAPSDGPAVSPERRRTENLARLILNPLPVQSDATVALVWEKNEDPKAAVENPESQLHASGLALAVVEREHTANLGIIPRVHNVRQNLGNVLGVLIASQRDRVVASYTLLAAVFAALIVAGLGIAFLFRVGEQGETALIASAASSARPPQGRTVLKAAPVQVAGLTIEAVKELPFRSEILTDGKIAVDEDRTTPVFSPYSGIVKRLAVKPGDTVERGQLLFTLEAADMIPAQNDFTTAVGELEIARSQFNLAQINRKRQRQPYNAETVPTRDWRQSEVDLIAAQSKVRTAKISLEVARHRLRTLRKTEQEIADFQKTGMIDPDTPICAPISGTIVQCKVDSGQYITAGGSDQVGDPVFVIGDLSTVWLLANIRETDALNIRLGQTVEFRVLAARDRSFIAKIDYVADALDPNTRRLLARATVDNHDRILKPRMFAPATILISDQHASPAVPRGAIIYEREVARVLVVADDEALELREITTGQVRGDMIQVIQGVSIDDRVVTKGTLPIDRAVSGTDS